MSSLQNKSGRTAFCLGALSFRLPQFLRVRGAERAAFPTPGRTTLDYAFLLLPLRHRKLGLALTPFLAAGSAVSAGYFTETLPRPGTPCSSFRADDCASRCRAPCVAAPGATFPCSSCVLPPSLLTRSTPAVNTFVLPCLQRGRQYSCADSVLQLLCVLHRARRSSFPTHPRRRRPRALCPTAASMLRAFVYERCAGSRA